MRQPNSKGTYVGVTFDKYSVMKIRELIVSIGVPNPIPDRELHSTILYSRRAICEVPYSMSVNYTARTNGLEIWQDGDKNILVLKILSTRMKNRHGFFINLGGTHDYPRFNQHITLSYDIEDWNIPPAPIRDFIIRAATEYSEVLKPD